MWKKLINILLIAGIGILIGYIWTSREERNIKIKNYESALDSLNVEKAFYESKADSLFLLRAQYDSVCKQKVREVTRYKFKECIKYITVETGLDSIQVETRDTDSVALLRKPELQVISGKLAELDGLRIKDSVNLEIIGVKDSVIHIQDTMLSLKDSVILVKSQEVKEAKKKAKKKFWTGLGIGVATGAAIIGLVVGLKK